MPRPALLTCMLLGLAGTALRGAEGTSSASPMVPVGNVASPEAGNSEDWQMLGVVDQAGTVIVSIRNVPAGESRWLRVGDAFGDLRLQAADPDVGRAEVTVAGEALTLYLRMPDRNAANARAPVATLYNPSLTPGTPAYERVQEREQLMNDYRGQLTEMMTRPGGPAGLVDSESAARVANSANAAAEVAATPVPDDGKTQEQREREARELMSDMLEIGMIQRRAYQQLKEASEREGTESAR